MTLDPIRLKTDVQTDPEGVRAMLLKLAPMLESRSPGITGQLSYFDMTQPLVMQDPSGAGATIRFDGKVGVPLTSIKVEVRPPARPMGRLRAWWWKARTRFVVQLALKRAKAEIAKTVPKSQLDDKGVVIPEVLPPK
jgi:hypothetical protein